MYLPGLCSKQSNYVFYLWSYITQLPLYVSQQVVHKNGFPQFLCLNLHFYCLEIELNSFLIKKKMDFLFP